MLFKFDIQAFSIVGKHKHIQILISTCIEKLTRVKGGDRAVKMKKKKSKLTATKSLYIAQGFYKKLLHILLFLPLQ